VFGVVTVVSAPVAVVVWVMGIVDVTGMAVGIVVDTVVVAMVVCRGVTASAGDGVGDGARFEEPAKNPLRRIYTTTRAMTATAMIPTFFRRRRCLFFRTISLYRAGR
jgi:hypothetical protein